MSDKVLAFTLLRLFMGLNLFMHGAVRLGENYGKFIEWVQGVFADTWLPSWLVTAEAALIPGVEILIGVLLFLGYKTRFALILAVGLIATLMFGMNIVQDWELVFRHVVYTFVFSYMLSNIEYNDFSLDGRNKNGSSQ